MLLSVKVFALLAVAPGLCFAINAAEPQPALPRAAPEPAPDFSGRIRQAFADARAAYLKQPESSAAAWQFGRACFDVAGYATNRAERAQIAQLGIAACRQLIVRESNSVPGHYYLGMNLAQLARTRGFSALRIVDEMEREFNLVRRLDAKFDDAGADRNLGLLYRDAPSIGSIGSRTKARQHLESAVTLAPSLPENRLNLLESYIQWGQRPEARRELRALETLWPSARTNLTSVEWAPAWPDWEARLKKVKQKVEAWPPPREKGTK